MSSDFDSSSMPDEIRQLGAFRRLYESSGRSVTSSALRGVFPMVVAVGMILAAEQWLKRGDWKYYLLVGLAVAMFLNGLRVVITAFRRRRQKIMLFEKGFALWRNDVLSVYKWTQVEEVDTSKEFFGFTIICTNDENRRDKIHFGLGIDPTQNMKELWCEVEEMSAKGRVPEYQRTIETGGEVTFVKKIWGKIVGTKIDLGQMGLRAKYRYDEPRFIFWRRLEAVTADGPLLVITEHDEEESWLTELTLEMPGYAAIVELSATARKRVIDTFEQIEKDRLPAALEKLKAGQEVIIGDYGVSLDAFRYKDQVTKWADVFTFQFEFDHFVFNDSPSTKNKELEYGKLSLADRLMVWSVFDQARELTDLSEDDDEEEFRDDEDESPTGSDSTNL